MGYNILQYEKQEIKKTDISEFCKEKMRPEKDLGKGWKEDDQNKVGQTKKKEFWNHDLSKSQPKIQSVGAKQEMQDEDRRSVRGQLKDAL